MPLDSKHKAVRAIILDALNDTIWRPCDGPQVLPKLTYGLVMM
jgi:hypothetical protein